MFKRSDLYPKEFLVRGLNDGTGGSTYRSMYICPKCETIFSENKGICPKCGAEGDWCIQ